MLGGGFPTRQLETTAAVYDSSGKRVNSATAGGDGS
jgi:hypothetical protein